MRFVSIVVVVAVAVGVVGSSDDEGVPALLLDFHSRLDCKRPQPLLKWQHFVGAEVEDV